MQNSIEVQSSSDLDSALEDSQRLKRIAAHLKAIEAECKEFGIYDDDNPADYLQDVHEITDCAIESIEQAISDYDEDAPYQSYEEQVRSDYYAGCL